MTLRIWDITRVKQSSGSDQVSISGKMTVLEGHSNWVTTVSWSPVKLANGHELVASFVFRQLNPLTTVTDYCIL